MTSPRNGVQRYPSPSDRVPTFWFAWSASRKTRAAFCAAVFHRHQSTYSECQPRLHKNSTRCSSSSSLSLQHINSHDKTQDCNGGFNVHWWRRPPVKLLEGTSWHTYHNYQNHMSFIAVGIRRWDFRNNKHGSVKFVQATQWPNWVTPPNESYIDIIWYNIIAYYRYHVMAFIRRLRGNAAWS